MTLSLISRVYSVNRSLSSFPARTTSALLSSHSSSSTQLSPFLKKSFSSPPSPPQQQASPLFLIKQRSFSSTPSPPLPPQLPDIKLTYIPTSPSLPHTSTSPRIALLTLARPKSKNALGSAMLEELITAIKTLPHDRTLRAVILNSDVEGCFCAGADLKERAVMTQDEAATFVSKLRSTLTQLSNISLPTIAVIEGFALGGGLELALSCDIIISDDKSVFALPETSIGIIPGAGGTQRLSRLIGNARSKELMFTGRRISANIAYDYGIVQHVTTPGNALQKATDIALEISKNAPTSIRLTKMAINRGLDVGLDEGLAIEEECYKQTLHTMDRQEGLKAFRGKRKPVFTGE